jgi:uncharacterized protein YwqG
MSVPNLSPESEAHLRELLEKYRLEEFAEPILASAIECVDLRRGGREDYAKVGNSRIGGVPDLPSDWEWPRSAGDGYLNFILQLNLGEVPSLVRNPLPERGVLYFFVEEEEPAYDVKARILHFEGESAELRRADAPDEEAFCLEYYTDLKAHKLKARRTVELPSYAGPLLETVGKKDRDKVGRRYGNLVTEAYEGDEKTIGQLFGYPGTLGGDPCVDAFLLRNGHEDWHEDEELQVEHRDEIMAGAAEWEMLLRVRSDLEVGISIWDSGYFEVLIRHEDLAARNYTNTHTVVETS